MQEIARSIMEKRPRVLPPFVSTPRESRAALAACSGVLSLFAGYSFVSGTVSVAELRVRFENHLPVGVVEDDRESREKLCADDACQVMRGKQARGILQEPRDRSLDDQFSDPEGGDLSGSGPYLAPDGSDTRYFGRLVQRNELGMCIAELLG